MSRHEGSTGLRIDERWAFFIDLDGTLVELVGHPEHAELTAAGRRALTALEAGASSAVAVISGRSIASVDRLLEPLQLPVAGLHGTERRGADGQVHRAPPAAEELIARARLELGQLAAAHRGILLEDKGSALAVHYRGAQEMAPEIRALTERLAAESAGALEVQPGKRVYELRPAGFDKGRAVAAFLEEAPFAGRRLTPDGADTFDRLLGRRGTDSGRRTVGLCDDQPEGDAFRAVLERGGHAIKVGAGLTTAQWRLPDPAAVIAWLAGERVAYPADKEET